MADFPSSQAQSAGPAVVHLHRRGDEHLAVGAASLPAMGRIGSWCDGLRSRRSPPGPKAASDREQPWPGAACRTKARLCRKPNPSRFCSWSAAMPLEWVAIRYTAQNQMVSGSFEPCITVLAVTDVCLPQPAHSQVYALAPAPSSCRGRNSSIQIPVAVVNIVQSHKRSFMRRATDSGWNSPSPHASPSQNSISKTMYHYLTMIMSFDILSSYGDQ